MWFGDALRSNFKRLPNEIGILSLGLTGAPGKREVALVV